MVHFMPLKTKSIDAKQLKIRRGEIKDLADIQDLNRLMCMKENRE